MNTTTSRTAESTERGATYTVEKVAEGFEVSGYEYTLLNGSAFNDVGHWDQIHDSEAAAVAEGESFLADFLEGEEGADR